MEEHSFFNIFANTHFETKYLKFRCVFDSHNARIHDDIDALTHLVEKKSGINLPPSIFFDNGEDYLKDLSLILSVAQGTHIFCDKGNLGRISTHRKKDPALFLAGEIEDFLNNSWLNFLQMEKGELEIIKTALFMFYEAKHFLFYDKLRGILMMNCFEFLLGAVYRRDNNFQDDDLKLQNSYKHLIEKYNYQKYIDDKLRENIKPKDLDKLKKDKNIPSVASFIDYFQKMRNWTAHGKQHTKPKIENSPSDLEFTFFYRLESFIRIILVDLIYRKDYARKFDVLYQLILEQNVNIMVTPEFPKLRFVEHRPLI